MKVLVISNYRETQSVRPEAELFIGLKKAGLDITVMTYGDAEYVSRFRAAGIRVIDFHPEKKFSRKEIRRIREELKESRYDLLHLFNSKAIINGIRAAAGLPVKVLLYRGYGGNIHWYDPTAYFKYLHPRVDKIWCISNATAEYVRRQLLFDKNRTVTIHKGHHPDWYNDVEASDRNTFKEVPKDGFWVTNVANNRPMKGIPNLLKAMDLLPTDNPIHLILIGKNMDTPENNDIIRKSVNRDKIHLLGYRTDVLNIVKTSDVFMLPSVKGEAITKSVIEAMSLGVAPVITDIPGNRELVIHRECGLVVPPGDPEAIAGALLELYQDRDKCLEYGIRAREHIEQNFHIRTTVKKMKRLYEALAGTGS